MSVGPKAILKAVSPRIAAKAIQTFDRATMVVVGVCWGVAIVMMIFAFYAVSVAGSNRRAAEATTASDPNLPVITHHNIDQAAAQALLQKLQRHYPDLNFGVDQNQTVSVTTSDGAKYRDWLAVLGYFDTIAPEYRWSFKDFCVGKCGGEIMHATLSGDRVSFETPQSPDNR